MFGQFIKVWWMLQWRLAFLTSFTFVAQFSGNPNFLPISFFVSLLAAALVFGFGKTVYIFPIFRLIFRKQVIGYLRGARPFEPNAPVDQPQGTYQAQASRPGRITGYEPQALRGIIPAGELMKGTPGKGLTKSNFDEQAIRAGQAGELRFAQAVKLYGDATQTRILDRLPSLWSVALPDATGRPDRQYKTDVDCVIVSDQTIFLIDIKNYKSGDLTYQTSGNQLYAYDNATGQYVGAPKHMSRNMAMAVERFAALFPQYTIKARVVFMPTDLGAAQVGGVYWPGFIPAVSVEELLGELGLAAGTSQSTFAAYAASRIQGLVK